MKLIVATIAWSLAAAAAAQTVTLHPGETVTLRLDNGKASVESHGKAAPMSDFEAFTLRRAQMQAVPPGTLTMPPMFIQRGETPSQPDPVANDRLQLTMYTVPALEPGSGDHTALLVRNGYGAKFRYRAVMSAAGRSAATDVCDVTPHMLGLEHWPFVIGQLDLSSLRLEPADGAVQCE